jgi:tetratricopeptide (TPR) repeat protein
MITVKHIIAAGYALSLGLSSCSGTSQVLEQSEFLASQGNHYQAYWLIVNASEDYPEDPELQRVFWDRRRDYLLEEARGLLYNEREHDAIAMFEKVLVIEPTNHVAQDWIKRALLKLAVREVRHGDVLTHEGQLQESLEHFNKALLYVPEYPPAVVGVKNVKDRNRKKGDRAIEQYQLGSRARGEYPPSYNRSAYHSAIALEMDKTLTRAEVLKKSSIRRIAEDRVKAAEKAEEDGFHAAALTEYKAVKSILPDYEDIDVRLARLEKEVDARKKCRDAEMILRKNDFDRADELLGEAFDLAVSGDVKAIVSGVMQNSKTRRYKEAFLRARDLELDWHLEKSLLGYKAVEEAFKKDYQPTDEEGFEGVRVRIREVESMIAEATDAYKQGEAAEKAGKIKEAIDYFGEASAVYPGFKDLKARVAKLREQL